MSRRLVGFLASTLSALAACGSATGSPDSGSVSAEAGGPCRCISAFWADEGMSGHFVPRGCVPGAAPLSVCDQPPVHGIPIQTP